MTDPEKSEPELIASDAVIERGAVTDTDEMKARWSLALSGISLAVGIVFLSVAICIKDDELRTWAMGLISLVVGAALGYAFGNKG